MPLLRYRRPVRFLEGPGALTVLLGVPEGTIFFVVGMPPFP